AHGSNPRIDQAIMLNERMSAFLRQEIGEQKSLAQSLQELESVLVAEQP
ncbi:MAG: flagellum-specific ATP synthase FliI, partial [Deltaproteobacteria bacterium]